MSFFSKLFAGKKSEENYNEISMESGVQNTDSSPDTSLDVSMEADTPLPFGYKIGWLAIKGEKPEQVIDILQLENKTLANWQSGMRLVESEEQIFVSPSIDGYVLLIGPMELELEELEEMAQNFEELQYFVSHRVVEMHSWTLFRAGKLVRHYYYIGESGEVTSIGKLTEEEKELGFDNLIMSEDDDWDEFAFPDEESVLKIAAAWSVDTSMQKHQEEKSVGYVCANW